MAVNLTAPFWLSKLAVEGWLAREKEGEEGKADGCILNIASVAGQVGLAAGAYLPLPFYILRSQLE